MKRLIAILTLSLGMLLVAPAPEASAWSGWNSSSRSRGWSGNRRVRRHRHRAHRYQRSGSEGATKKPTASHSVPELDPGAAGSAIVLLLGGIAYIASRRREDNFA